MSDEDFCRIIQKYRKTVYAAAYCYVKNSYDADDIMQDIFLKLYTTDEKFSDDEHIKAWLIRCTVNRSKDLLRSFARRFGEPLSAAENIPAPQSAGIEDDEMYPLIMKLGKKTRLTLYMHYYEGYEPCEIADILRCAPETIYARLKRGRKALKNMLDSENGKENCNEI